MPFDRRQSTQPRVLHSIPDRLMGEVCVIEPKGRASAFPDVEAHIALRNKIITFLGIYRGACIWTFWLCLAFKAPTDPVDTASQAALVPDSGSRRHLLMLLSL
jgi:hypothetical protein